MIENFLMKDQFTYSLVISVIIASVTAGYFLGHRDPADICSAHIVKLDQEKEDHLQTNDELTQCKAKLAAEKVLDCVSICDKRVKEALEKKKEWICND